MAFGVEADCKLSDLGLIAAGDGDDTSSSTSEISLVADCAGNPGSPANISLWNSFKSGSRSLSNAGTGVQSEDYVWILAHNTAVDITSTISWASGGTYFTSRVLTPNTNWLGGKWQINKTSGNDTYSVDSGTYTQKVWTWTTGTVPEANTDFWKIKMVTPSNTAWERFLCNTTGSGNDMMNDTTDASCDVSIYDVEGTLP